MTEPFPSREQIERALALLRVDCAGTMLGGQWDRNRWSRGDLATDLAPVLSEIILSEPVPGISCDVSAIADVISQLPGGPIYVGRVS